MVFVGFHLFSPYDGGGPNAIQITKLYQMTGLTAVKILAEYSNDPQLLYMLLDDRRNGRNQLQCVILRMSSRAAYNPANPNAAVSVGTIAAKLSEPNRISGKSWGQAIADATAAGVTVWLEVGNEPDVITDESPRVFDVALWRRVYMEVIKGLKYGASFYSYGDYAYFNANNWSTLRNQLSRAKWCFNMPAHDYAAAQRFLSVKTAQDSQQFSRDEWVNDGVLQDWYDGVSVHLYSANCLYPRWAITDGDLRSIDDLVRATPSVKRILYTEIGVHQNTGCVTGQQFLNRAQFMIWQYRRFLYCPGSLPANAEAVTPYIAVFCDTNVDSHELYWMLDKDNFSNNQVWGQLLWSSGVSQYCTSCP